MSATTKRRRDCGRRTTSNTARISNRVAKGFSTSCALCQKTLQYQPGVIAADEDYVIVYGRFSGNARPRAWIAADVCRIANGVLAERWDVLQAEATKVESR